MTLHLMTFEEFLWAVGEEQMAEAIRAHARTLSTFMTRSHAPYAVVFSERNFGVEQGERGEEIKCLPLYAAHCLEEGLVRADA